MSRTNPSKKKPRYARATAQIVVEGYTEEAFCRHLKSLYAHNCGVKVDIHNARGGSPQDAIKSALKRKGFDKTLILFDTDVPLPKTWRDRANAKSCKLITPAPCIEAFFLDLLGQPCNGDTADCKRTFEAIIPPPDKFTPAPYADHFPQSLLDEQKNNNRLLADLLTAFRP